MHRRYKEGNNTDLLITVMQDFFGYLRFIQIFEFSCIGITFSAYTGVFRNCVIIAEIILIQYLIYDFTPLAAEILFININRGVRAYITAVETAKCFLGI